MADVLVDSNIWIYAFIENKSWEFQRKEAIRLIERLKKEGKIFVSTQIINEFHWVLMRKYRVTESDIRERVIDGIAKVAEITLITKDFYDEAFSIRERYGISFWDSFIIVSALKNRCSEVYSEDMADDLVIESKLRIVNPFK